MRKDILEVVSAVFRWQRAWSQGAEDRRFSLMMLKVAVGQSLQVEDRLQKKRTRRR